MKWDVNIISTDEYILEEICTEIIPDKYWLNDRGEYLIAGNTFNSESSIYLLIDFIFQGSGPVTKIYRNENGYVLDLSALRQHLVDFDYLDKFYPRWLKRSRRRNSMSEYGMLIDFIGFARKGLEKKYLLMVVYCRQE